MRGEVAGALMITREVPVIEIGGTHATAAVVDPSGWAVVPGTMVRRDLDAGAPAGVLVQAIVDTAASLRRPDRTTWGVAIPGPFDDVRGVGDFTGVGKLDGLRGVDLGEVLRRELTAGSGLIVFVNDAEAFAVGEWVAGAATGHHRTIAITLGTGVGSTFLVDGVGPAHRSRRAAADGLSYGSSGPGNSTTRRWSALPGTWSTAAVSPLRA